MTFGDFLRSLGLQPRTVSADGRWHRCPTDDHPRKKIGAWKLAPDGLIGWAQNHATMQTPVTWRANGDATPAVDPRRFAETRREAREASRKATEAARLFYAQCKPLRRGHAYLDSHGLDMTGCHGLKVDPDGWLVIPSFHRHDVQTLQRISPDGDKRFWPGASVSGSCYWVAHRGYTVTVFCEGLATGLACYTALPNSRVIVAWNAGNLARLKWTPRGLTVIAADNDHATEERIGANPGLDAARELAERIGCGVACPEGIEGTDFADYRMERMAAIVPGRFESKATVTRKVDAEVARLLLRQARYIA
jgi:putative DNA primase/helicase